MIATLNIGSESEEEPASETAKMARLEIRARYMGRSLFAADSEDAANNYHRIGALTQLPGVQESLTPMERVGVAGGLQ